MNALTTFKLFELDDLYYKTLYSAMDPDTGEIVDEVLEKKLNEIVEAKDKKLLNLACLYRALILETVALKTQEDVLKSRRQTIENRAKSLFSFINANLKKGEKLGDDRVTLSWRKSESIEVDLQDHDILYKLGEEFTYIEYTPKKKELKEAIKAGIVFPGVRLVLSQNLQIK
ncbi:siphovirus Gp157 family protein [Leptospira noguchii]|uniref:Bacteriophage resistance factor, PF05565 family n=1 Tax=Leptospira noguchii TaxID=28182 RepID=M6V8Y3_9LEPT|nr:siphovirus Gp157 family protein [Leptospira noguchii]EMO53882.1 bacteriophage resistance factor, PF05565 family [Leptospira noguchii]